LKGKTILFVTHGLHYVKNCDNILVMKDGQIVETGNYNNLMNKNGLFRELSMQKNYDEE